MLRKCTKEEFIEHIDFAYELASDLRKSGYPTFCDGVKTKKTFIEHSLKAFENDNEDMLSFIVNGEIQGFIHYYWIKEDNYLSTCSFNINICIEQALNEFLAFSQDCFPGYELYLGYPEENAESILYLQKHGFECIEESYNNTAFLQKLEIKPVDGIIRINKNNYSLFKEIHCCMDNEMYWNCDRIENDLDRWVLFVKIQQNKPVGAVYIMDEKDGWYEVFGIDLVDKQFNERIFSDLLQAALNEAIQLGGKTMSFFCEEVEEKTALASGFKLIGKYQCYKKII